MDKNRNFGKNEEVNMFIKNKYTLILLGDSKEVNLNILFIKKISRCQNRVKKIYFTIAAEGLVSRCIRDASVTWKQNIKNIFKVQ